MNWLVFSLGCQGRHADGAEVLDAWVPTLLAHRRPDDHELVINFDRQYATALLKSRRYLDCEAHLLSALCRWQNAPVGDPSYATAIAHDLVTLYAAWDVEEPGRHAAQAAEWQAWLAERVPATQPASLPVKTPD